MTKVLDSPIEAKKRFRFWAAFGGPVGLWGTISKGGRELTWVLAGKFVLMGSNAVVMLFLARHLDLTTYGLFFLTIAGQLLVSRLLLMGVDSGMVRLIALPELRARADEVISAGLVTIILFSCVLVFITGLGGVLLSARGVPGWVLGTSAAGAIGTALVDYGYDYRLARAEYSLAALAQGGTALWRLILTILAAVTIMNPVAVFIMYHGASLASGVFQTSLIARGWKRPGRGLISKLLRYSFWQAKSNVIVIFCLYQGTFILTFLDQQTETGIFGLGLTLSLGFFAIYNAYIDYLLAIVRELKQIAELRDFIKRTLALSLILVLTGVPIALILAWLMPFFLGPRWSEIVPTFAYLSASMMLLILQAPLEAACHYMLKPRLSSYGWWTRLAVATVAAIVLVPRLAAIGAAIAQLIGAAVALLVLVYLVYRHHKKEAAQMSKASSALS